MPSKLSNNTFLVTKGDLMLDFSPLSDEETLLVKKEENHVVLSMEEAKLLYYNLKSIFSETQSN